VTTWGRGVCTHHLRAMEFFLPALEDVCEYEVSSSIAPLSLRESERGREKRTECDL
jgi:hypothetical protein